MYLLRSICTPTHLQLHLQLFTIHTFTPTGSISPWNDQIWTVETRRFNGLLVRVCKLNHDKSGWRYQMFVYFSNSHMIPIMPNITFALHSKRCIRWLLSLFLKIQLTLSIRLFGVHNVWQVCLLHVARLTSSGWGGSLTQTRTYKQMTAKTPSVKAKQNTILVLSNKNP